MPSARLKRILIAPLDWGLGHTTRCVPIIRYLRGLGHDVIVAGNERQRAFIDETFGDIETIHLEGYNVTYGEGNRLLAHIGRQIPRLLKTVRTEHRWLMEHAGQLNVDGIISDNRYGLYHPAIPNVMITHQLQVLTGMGRIADGVSRKWHYKFLFRFNEIWVPDNKGEDNLSGQLGHPAVLPPNVNYMGLLSQFDAFKRDAASDDTLIVLLSGPEPQRSILSDILWTQIKSLRRPVIFVEGSNNANKRLNVPEHVSYHLQLVPSLLKPLLEQAGLVICRSGYSTLMDLVALGKKAIVIPTPGQTEQEYLGRYLYSRKWFYLHSQQELNLDDCLLAAAGFSFNVARNPSMFAGYKPIVDRWLEQL